MIGLTSKWRPFLGAYMVFGILCAVAAMFTYGALAQEKPELQRKSTEKVEKLQMSVNEVLKNDKLNERAAHVRDMLKLIASDYEVAGAILRAASANRAERSAAVDEANLLIKKKSPTYRVKAGRGGVISDGTIADVYPVGDYIIIRICVYENGKLVYCATVDTDKKQ